MTLHQLRIFLAVAHATTLTRASKQLGLAQPSVSKQLATLEGSLGTRLFNRGHNSMELTDAGHLLLRHAQSVLKEVDEAEAGLREFAGGRRAVIRIAGLNSIIKAVVPDALRRCGGAMSGIEIDIHEAAPGEVIDMLYARQAHIGLIASGTIAQSSVGFRQLPVVDDPYVFAVPSTINLASLKTIDDASPDVARVLSNCIQFHFGTQHTLRVQQWYQHLLPSHRLVAHCRTYEVALGLVRSGFGVSLVPALTAFLIEGSLEGIDLFATDHGIRSTVALVSDQYLRLSPYKEFIAALRAAGLHVTMPPVKPMPPIVRQALDHREETIRNFAG
jgi:DNA-binding transcriptional LysR family regulator